LAYLGTSPFFLPPKMASYAEILKDDGKENENTNTNINTKSNSSSEKVKPVFLKDKDVFGSSI
jgi:hypothetical protein